jgi:hypothetical protein
MAVSRLKLANVQPLISLERHPYQQAFMAARRLRVCAKGHTWDAGQGALCLQCTLEGARAYGSLLLIAGRRGGKTRIGAVSVIEEIATPNVLWWACAPTYPKLEDYVLPAFFKQVPKAWLDHPDTDWAETGLTLTLPNRSQIQFRSLEDEDRGRGPGLNGVWIDEICELTLNHWETISPALADKAGSLIATTSPKGKDWVYKTFYEPAEKGEPGFWACRFTTLDNPWMQRPAQRAYVERQRRNMTPLMFEQEYLAAFVTFQGAIYGDLVRPCIIEGTEEEMRHYFPEWPNLNASRQNVMGLDPGFDHPFAAGQFVASPHGLVLTGEYLQRRAFASTHAEHIKALHRDFDGQIAIDRSQPQMLLELSQYGILCVPAENDVIAGINRVSAWMLRSQRHRINDLPGGLVLPKRYARETIESLSNYRWAETVVGRQGGSKEMVYKVDDDAADMVRYALMTYPELPDTHPAVIGAGKRDLSALPAKTRLEIERERRSLAAENPDGLVEMDDDLVPVTGMGDFALY